MAVELVGSTHVVGAVPTVHPNTLEQQAIAAITFSRENFNTSPPSGWLKIGQRALPNTSGSISVFMRLFSTSWAMPTFQYAEWSQCLSFSGANAADITGAVIHDVGTSASVSLQAATLEVNDGSSYFFRSVMHDSSSFIPITPDTGYQAVIAENNAGTSPAMSTLTTVDRTTVRDLITNTYTNGDWAGIGVEVLALPGSKAEGTFNWQGVAFGSAVPTPSGLTATLVDFTRVDLSWNPASGAKGYDLERNGVIIATDIAGTTYSDTNGITPQTTYTYRVRAVKK